MYSIKAVELNNPNLHVSILIAALLGEVPDDGIRPIRIDLAAPARENELSVSTKDMDDEHELSSLSSNSSIPMTGWTSV